MLHIILYITAGMMLYLVLLMARFPDFFDRMICVNMFINLGVIAIVTLGSYSLNSSFIDIAIIYLSLGYVVNIAIAKIS